ncbi:MAG: hypothetical protein ACOZNI_09860 [Myxococcota bacterium]
MHIDRMDRAAVLSTLLGPERAGELLDYSPEELRDVARNPWSPVTVHWSEDERIRLAAAFRLVDLAFFSRHRRTDLLTDPGDVVRRYQDEFRNEHRHTVLRVAVNDDGRRIEESHVVSSLRAPMVPSARRIWGNTPPPEGTAALYVVDHRPWAGVHSPRLIRMFRALRLRARRAGIPRFDWLVLTGERAYAVSDVERSLERKAAA